MAPLAHRVTRVTLSGHMFGGAEEWSTGFYIGQEGADAQLPDQATANAIATAWAAFFTNQGSYVANSYTAELVKLASVGIDGKSSSADTIYANMPAGTAGTKTTNFPPQNALVATLTGPNVRGLASKGRMYLPGIVAPVQPDGHIDLTTVGTIATNVQTFLKAVDAITSTPDRLILASHGQLTKSADGKHWIPKVGGIGPVNKPVTGCKVGNVYDTQRRRRNGLVEAYVSKTLP